MRKTNSLYTVMFKSTFPKWSHNQKLQNQTSSNTIFTVFMIYSVHSNVTYEHTVKQKYTIYNFLSPTLENTQTVSSTEYNYIFTPVIYWPETTICLPNSLIFQWVWLGSLAKHRSSHQNLQSPTVQWTKQETSTNWWSNLLV